MSFTRSLVSSMIAVYEENVLQASLMIPSIHCMRLNSFFPLRLTAIFSSVLLFKTSNQAT